MNANQRKAAERQRYKDAGLVPVQVWVKPEHRQAINDLAEALKASDRPQPHSGQPAAPRYPQPLSDE